MRSSRKLALPQSSNKSKQSKNGLTNLVKPFFRTKKVPFQIFCQKTIDNYDKIVYTNSREAYEGKPMERLFVQTEPFLKSWQAMGLGEESLKDLEEYLLVYPQSGDVIQGTGGARKLRIALDTNKGKSGGARVIYLDVFKKEKVYLLFAYPKSVQENLTAEQKKAVKEMVERIKKEG